MFLFIERREYAKRSFFRLTALITGFTDGIGKATAISLAKNGYDLIFMVGYISRYIFSVMLNETLENTKNSRVMHIGELKSKDELLFDEMKNTNKKLRKTISIPYTASAYLAYYYNRLGITKVPHEYMGPGATNTNAMKQMVLFIKFLSKLPFV